MPPPAVRLHGSVYNPHKSYTKAIVANLSLRDRLQTLVLALVGGGPAYAVDRLYCTERW